MSGVEIGKNQLTINAGASGSTGKVRTKLRVDKAVISDTGALSMLWVVSARIINLIPCKMLGRVSRSGTRVWLGCYNDYGRY